VQLAPPRLALELGCGDDPNVATYVTNHWPLTMLVGLDHDFTALKLITKQYPHLVEADVQRLPFSIKFALIIIRHPDLDRHYDAWHDTMFDLPVTPDGIVVITVYSIAEAERVRGWFSSMSFAPLWLENSRLQATHLDGRDRFVFVYRHLGSV
jgi:hypothetical protein